MTQLAGSGNMLPPLVGDESGSVTRFHFVTTSPVLFNRFEEVEKAGVEAARSWIDHER